MEGWEEKIVCLLPSFILIWFIAAVLCGILAGTYRRGRGRHLVMPALFILQSTGNLGWLCAAISFVQIKDRNFRSAKQSVWNSGCPKSAVNV